MALHALHRQAAAARPPAAGRTSPTTRGTRTARSSNEASLLAEMEMAAAHRRRAVRRRRRLVGRASTPTIAGDFARGWGNWEVDPDRFPNGLGALSDHAHELGMRFGIWVEPERVDRRHGRPAGPGAGAVPRDARRPLRSRACRTTRRGVGAGLPGRRAGARLGARASSSQFIDEVRPDYLKWDNNFWINCNRAGHGHGAEDGNFAAPCAGCSMVLDQTARALPEPATSRTARAAATACRSTCSRTRDVGLARRSHVPVEPRSSQPRGPRSACSRRRTSLTFTLSTAEEPVDGRSRRSTCRTSSAAACPACSGSAGRARIMSEGTARGAVAARSRCTSGFGPILQDGSSYPAQPARCVSIPTRPLVRLGRRRARVAADGRRRAHGVRHARRPDERRSCARRGCVPTRSTTVESADYGVLGTVDRRRADGAGDRGPGVGHLALVTCSSCTRSASARTPRGVALLTFAKN